MGAYRFSTKISDKGIIKLTENSDLFNQEVDVIIFPHHGDKKNKLSAIDFVEKWGGVLKTAQPPGAKYEYLNEKYQ